MTRLIWPPRALQPNQRPHWSAKARAAKLFRLHARSCFRGVPVPAGEAIGVTLTFCPPDRRARDLDNLQAACKSLFDGLADALGIDDKHFRPRSEFGDVDPAGLGYILVTLEGS